MLDENKEVLDYHLLNNNVPLSELYPSLTDDEQVIENFYEVVRSGTKLEQVGIFMANEVKANQMNSENFVTITRTPLEYAEHINEMLEIWGNFKIEVQEIFSNENKVYVRWKQSGKHRAEYDGYAPTNKEVIEVGSAVYRLENKKIVEYWIQVDRLGILEQLKINQE